MSLSLFVMLRYIAGTPGNRVHFSLAITDINVMQAWTGMMTSSLPLAMPANIAVCRP